jgi:5'-nucleotidase
VVKSAVRVASSGPVPPVCTAPVPPSKGCDFAGWIKYGLAWIQYQKCLKG